MESASYINTCIDMTEHYGYPAGFGDVPDTGLSESTLRDRLVDRWNPTRDHKLAHLLGLRWGLWVRIQGIQAIPEIPMLRELEDDTAALVNMDAEIRDGIKQHTLSIMREYYATVTALEKAYRLTLAEKDMTDLSQLATKASIHRRAEPSKARAEADIPLPPDAEFKTRGETPQDSSEAMRTYSIISSKIGKTTLLSKELIQLQKAGLQVSIEALAKNQYGRDKGGIRYIRQKTAEISLFAAGWNNRLSNQHQILLKQLRLAGKKNNLIPGKTADERLLLEDDGIPLPEPCTVMAWWALTGLKLVKVIDGTYRALAILPHMPMTYDHVNRGGVIDSGSDTNHSLPAKSAAHLRNHFGGIDYGLWQSLSLVIKQNDAWTVEQNALQSVAISPMAIMADFWTSKRVSRVIIPDPAIPRDTAAHLEVTWCDPYLNTGINQTPYWVNTPRTTIDEPMRFLAMNKIHFRFTSLESAAKWSDAFARALQAYLFQHPLTYELNISAKAAVYDSINPDYVRAASGSQKVKLSF